MIYAECSTETGRRNHRREPGAQFTFCGRPAVARKTDQAHRNDAVCHRCVAVSDERGAQKAGQ